MVVEGGDEEYEIDRLLQKRRIRKGKGWSTRYLIRWLGYCPEADSWLPEHRFGYTADLI